MMTNINAIAAAMEQSSVNLNTVASAAEKMAAQSTVVVAQVTDGLGEVDRTTSDMSQRSREVLSGAEGLSAMAEQLNGLVGRFKI